MLYSKVSVPNLLLAVLESYMLQVRTAATTTGILLTAPLTFLATFSPSATVRYRASAGLRRRFP